MNELASFIEDRVSQFIFFLVIGALHFLLILVFQNHPFLALISSGLVAIFAGVFVENLVGCGLAALEFLIGIGLGGVVFALLKAKGIPAGGIFALLHLIYSVLAVNMLISMPSWVIGVPVGRFIRSQLR